MNRQFPPEIIQLIVEASLDPYNFFTAMGDVFSARYAILRSYSLLNSTWYGASQPELVRFVELYTDESVEKFLETAERRGGTVEGVRDLCVSGACDGDSTTLPMLLKSTPQLLNLYCYGVTMTVDDLAQLQRLRRLELVAIDVTGSPSSSLLCLPHLQRFSMTDVVLEGSASHLLTPAFLPQLRRIDTDDFGSIAPLISQLQIIVVDSEDADFALLPRAKSLLLLQLPLYPDDRLAMFSNLPSLPPFCHIGFAILDVDVDHEVALALEELLEAKKPGLRIILLNDYGISESVKSLIQRLLEGGIMVQMVDRGLDSEGAIDEMYRIRAKEERAMEDGAGQGV